MKLALIIVLTIFILIQFIPIERDNPVSDPSSEIELQGEVKMIVQTSCYDCHSNNTTWPWYSYVAPVSWLVTYDVHEAREELNFSMWNTYSQKRMNRKFQEIVEEIEEEEMPLPIYLLTHSKADIDQAQRTVLINWANSNLDSLSLKQ